MKKIDLSKVSLKGIVVALSLIAVLAVGALTWQQVQAMSTASVDYTSIIRTETYPTVKVKIEKYISLQSVWVYYKYPQQTTWAKVRMSKVATDASFKTFAATIPQDLDLDSPMQYYVKFYNADGTRTTRPTDAPNHYFTIEERLITVKP